MSSVKSTGSGTGPGRVPLVAVAWVGLLTLFSLLALPVGPHRGHVEQLLAASLATLAVVGSFAVVGARRVPADLRWLRAMAVVLPSLFVVVVEVALYFLAVYGWLSEVGQHMLATAILSLGAVPFAVYMFRAFARLRDELATSRLEEAQLLATVEERERIARDLHDDLGQLLGFLTAKIQAVHELVVRGREPQALRELDGLEQASRMLGSRVREAILGLRVRMGADRPLGQALADYVADFGVLAELDCVFEGSPDAGRGLSEAKRYQVLRVAQEAMSNARRHARADRVTVRLVEKDGHLDLSVTDDGVGFNPGVTRAGFGLKTMTERAHSLAGEFEVRSAPGEGTSVRLWVPVGGG
jgi:signal transduction histidine kinase